VQPASQRLKDSAQAFRSGSVVSYDRRTHLILPGMPKHAPFLAYNSRAMSELFSAPVLARPLECTCAELSSWHPCSNHPLCRQPDSFITFLNTLTRTQAKSAAEFRDLVRCSRSCSQGHSTVHKLIRSFVLPIGSAVGEWSGRLR
jgi:hypothetical protein